MKHYQPKNILVTGGAGFIGANFIHYLLKNDRQVKIINLDLLTYAGKQENLKNLPDPARHFFVRGDIGDRSLVDRLLRENTIETIVHFAAESHVDRSILDPAVFIKTNVLGTFTLLEAARQYWLQEQKLSKESCRFHHISTDEVYGSLGPQDPPFTETTPYAPNSPYSASKAGSDHLVRAYFHTYGLPVTTSNCSNNYGSYQDQEKLIPKIIHACLNSKPIPIYGNGSNIRDWLYVEDHCLGIMAVLSKGVPGANYNIGGNNEKTNMEVVKTVCNLMNKMKPQSLDYNELITFVKDRPGHDQRYAVNISKTQEELAWQPRTSFLEGIEKTIHWYSEQNK